MSFKMAIMGDLFPRDDSITAFQNQDITTLFDEQFRSRIKSADYRICNLEGCLTDGAQKTKKCGPVVYAPTSVIKTYKELGIDKVCLANNHIMDCAKQGFRDTISTLEKENIGWFGAGEDASHIVKTDHIVVSPTCRVAVYAVSEQMFNAPTVELPGANIFQETKTLSDIKQLKAENDWVVALYHGGQEFYPYPSPLLRERMHLLGDAGADVIIVQHSHQLVGREKYNRTEILYGQGNTHFFAKKRMIETGVIVCINFEEKDYSVEYQHIERREMQVHCTDMPKEFLDRSQKIEEGNPFREDFLKFCDKKMLNMLGYYRGNNLIDKVAKKFMSESQYERYLLSRFSEEQLLRILNSYRCDEHREATIAALEDILKV